MYSVVCLIIKNKVGTYPTFITHVFQIYTTLTWTYRSVYNVKAPWSYLIIKLISISNFQSIALIMLTRFMYKFFFNELRHILVNEKVKQNFFSDLSKPFVDFEILFNLSLTSFSRVVKYKNVFECISNS